MSILLKPLVSTVCMLINLLDCLVPGGAGFRLRCHHFCTCIGFIRVNVSEDTFDSEHLPDPTKTTVEGRGKIYIHPPDMKKPLNKISIIHYDDHNSLSFSLYYDDHDW